MTEAPCGSFRGTDTGSPAVQLSAQGNSLAAIQALQIGTGLLGQLWLLARWSSRSESDVFILLSGIPWIAGAVLLVGGLDLCVPAAVSRAVQGRKSETQSQFFEQLTGLTLLAALAATLASGSVITVWATQLEVPTIRALVMGAALGGQLVPYALASLWRGYLIAKNRSVPARLPLLVGSLVTAVGYGLVAGPPSTALPAVTIGATASVAFASWLLCRADGQAMVGIRRSLRACSPPWHPDIVRLLYSLVALGVAAGLLHGEALVVRASVLPLGTGTVTALSVANRGWDAVLALIVTAGILPAYPCWARGQAASQGVLRWSLLRTWGLTLAAAVIVGALSRLGPWLAGVSRQPSIARGAEMAWVLLPRFALLSGLQPLVLRHYASGNTWHPVIASALGLVILYPALLVFVPRWGLVGLAAALALGVVPGWGYLGLRAWREAKPCAS